MVTVPEALAGVRGPVVTRFKYQWKDHGGDVLGDVTDAIISCSMDLDNERHSRGGVLRSADFSLDPALLPSGFALATSHVSPVAVILVDGVETDFPLGLMHFNEPSHEQRDDPASLSVRDVVEVSATDIGVHLFTSIGTPYTVASGTNVTTALGDALDAAATALGTTFLHTLLPLVTQTTPVERTWGPTATWRKVLDDIALVANLYPVWPNVDGNFKTKERIPPHTQTIAVTYSTLGEPRMIVEPFVSKLSSVRLTNRAVVLINHPDRTAEFALRENRDAASPIGIGNAATEVLDEIQGGYVFDIALAGEIAEFVLYAAAARAEAAELETFFDPRREAHEVYALTIDDLELSSVWLVGGWKVDLEAGATMAHDIGRATAITITTP